MMSLSRTMFGLVLVLCLTIFTTLFASTFVSDVALVSQVPSQRRLLQASMKCPIDFEFQNYTILTSKCKPPDYKPKPCCSAFKEFACQFVNEIDDLRNDCVTVMFNYINLNGKYPAGLFASLCREGKEGLDCPDPPPPPSEQVPKTRKKNNVCQMICDELIILGSLVLSLHFI